MINIVYISGNNCSEHITKDLLSLERTSSLIEKHIYSWATFVSLILI